MKLRTHLLSGIFLGAMGVALATTAIAESQPVTRVVDEQTRSTLHPDLSLSARNTMSRDPITNVVRTSGYDSRDDMIRAGDMAAFVSQSRDAFGERDADPNDWIAVIIDDIAKQRFGDARKALTEVSQLDRSFDGFTPDFFEAWLLLFDDRSDEALASFGYAERELPSLGAYLGRADLLEALGRQDEAMAVYDSLLPQDIIAPEHDFDPQGISYAVTELLVGRKISLLLDQNDTETATTLARKLLAADPENAQHQKLVEYIESGEAMTDREEKPPKTDVQRFASSFASMSGILNQQRMLAEALQNQRPRAYSDEAALYSQLASMLVPDNAELREGAVDLLFRAGHFDGAGHVALLTPVEEESRPYFMLRAAQAMVQLDREEAARTLSQQALALDVEPSDKLNAGWTLKQIGDLDAARTVLTEAIGGLEEDRQIAYAYALRADVEYWQGNTAAALTSAQAAYELDPTDMLELSLASAEVNAGKVEQGIARYQAYLLRNPNDPNAMNALGYTIITETDELDRGYGILRRASQGAPNDAAITDSLGWAYYLYGDLEQAERLVKRSLELFEPFNHWEVLDHYGDIKWHLGEPDEARQYWRDALADGPPQRFAVKMQDKIDNGILTPPPERRAPPGVKIEPGTTKRDRI